MNEHDNEIEDADVGIYLSRIDSSLNEVIKEIEGAKLSNSHRSISRRAILVTDGCIDTRLIIDPKGSSVSDGFIFYISIDNYTDDYLLNAKGFFDYQRRCLINLFRGKKKRYVLETLDEAFKIPDSVDEQKTVLRNAWELAVKMKTDFAKKEN